VQLVGVKAGRRPSRSDAAGGLDAGWLYSTMTRAEGRDRPTTHERADGCCRRSPPRPWPAEASLANTCCHTGSEAAVGIGWGPGPGRDAGALATKDVRPRAPPGVSCPCSRY